MDIIIFVNKSLHNDEESLNKNILGCVNIANSHPHCLGFFCFVVAVVVVVCSFVVVFLMNIAKSIFLMATHSVYNINYEISDLKI